MIQTLINRPQTTHGEFDAAVRQLPPLLNNRHVIALTTLIDNLTSRGPSRVNRQPERLTYHAARLRPAAHTLCKIAGSIGHVVTPPRNIAAGQLLFVATMEPSPLSTAWEAVDLGRLLITRVA
jgi:hypothetical protein